MRMTVEISEDATPEQLAELACAVAHPREAFAEDPDRFIRFVQTQAPGVSRDQIVQTLNELDPDNRPPP